MLRCLAFKLKTSEAGGGLVLVQTSPVFLRKLLLINLITTTLTQEKQEGFYQNKVNSSVTFIQRPLETKHTTVKWSIGEVLLSALKGNNRQIVLKMSQSKSESMKEACCQKYIIMSDICIQTKTSGKGSNN